MKRRSGQVQRSGSSPYAKKAKTAYAYPAWVRDKRMPIPSDIRRTLVIARPLLASVR